MFSFPPFLKILSHVVESGMQRATQDYFDQFPQENGSIFLFNTYTGEAIYDVDQWGSPLPGARTLSHWFGPTAVVPPATEGEPVDTHNVSSWESTLGRNPLCPGSFADWGYNQVS